MIWFVFTSITEVKHQFVWSTKWMGDSRSSIEKKRVLEKCCLYRNIRAEENCSCSIKSTKLMYLSIIEPEERRTYGDMWPKPCEVY